MSRDALSSRRYVELVDRLNGSFSTLLRYLELRIELLEIELSEKRMNRQQKDDKVTYT